MQSHVSTNSSSDSAPATHVNSTPGSQVHSSHTAGSSTRAREPRTQTKWPEDRLAASGIDAEGWLIPDSARDRFVLVCGLIARERVSINRKVKDLTEHERERVVQLFTGKAGVPNQSIRS
ncbi:unnamed protein product [Urochloa humidicola]